LLATKVITRIREAFGLNVPLRVLFDSPTIAGSPLTLRRRGRKVNSTASRDWSKN
jgi:hypothetical protein